MTPRSRKPQGKFLSTDQINNTTKLVVEQWRVGGRIALIGGAALNFYGSDRFTKDVDFIADDTTPADDAADLKRISGLSFGGSRYMAPDQVPVDVIVREDQNASLYGEALDRAEPTDEGFLIVTPEYLAAMKYQAMRGKDEIDLLWMLAQKGLVNAKKAEAVIREHCGGHRAAKEFRLMVKEATWREEEGEFDDQGEPDDGSEE